MHQIALNRVLRRFSLILIACLAGDSVQAAQPIALKQSAREFQDFSRPNAGAVTTEGENMRAVSHRPDPEAWAVQIQSTEIAIPIKKGETLCFTFEARTVQSEIGGEGSMHVYFAKDKPWEAMQSENGFRTVTVPADWHTYNQCFTAHRDFGPGELYGGIQFALRKQTIELRGLKISSFGDASPDQWPVSQLYYPGREDTSWKDDALERIETFRKTDLTVRVVDARGNPISGAKVHVQQQRHEYAFGTFVGETPVKAGEDSERYCNQTKAWFNRVTLPRYWAEWGTATPYGTLRADGVANWAASQDFELKTHLLLYPQFIPEPVKQLADRPKEFRTAIERAMDEALHRTQPIRCEVWDAINELRDVSLVGDTLGTSYYAEVFNRGNRAQPDATWFINEYGILVESADRQAHVDEYIETIRKILQDGGALEGIGVQSHFSEELTPIPDVLATLNQLSEFKLPIEVTEYDIDTRDEATQAAYTRDFLTAVFSHPSTTGFTTWGFWQGDMWKPNGAMIRTDWSVKPNGKVWEEMIYEQWWTDEEAVSNDDGLASFRVFRGKHRIIAEARDFRGLNELPVVEATTIEIPVGVWLPSE